MMTTPHNSGTELWQRGTSDAGLGYDIFVADPIAMNVVGSLPNGERHMFRHWRPR
jgi:hypothetical protein